MTEWEPATEDEAAMRDALRVNDQELYFRILARTELLLPIVTVTTDDGTRQEWGTWTTTGRTHVLAFSSSAALAACLPDEPGSVRRVPYRELAGEWPDGDWWLAINPGLPIEGYLPAWFVAQLARENVRLPGRAMGAEVRLARVSGVARARASVPVPGRTQSPETSAPPRPVSASGAAHEAPVDSLTASPPRYGSGPQLVTVPQPVREPPAQVVTDSPAVVESPGPFFRPARPVGARPLPVAVQTPTTSAPAPAVTPATTADTSRVREDSPVPQKTLVPQVPPVPQDPPVPRKTLVPHEKPSFASVVAPAVEPAASVPAVAPTTAGTTAPATPGTTAPVPPAEAATSAAGGSDFVPANDVEAELFAAASAGSTQSFLSTLLLARVLLPVSVTSAVGARPGDDGFVWRTERLDGDTHIVVFTSPERCADYFTNPVETVQVKFAQLIRRWPDDGWSFAVNPNTPAGAKLPGNQIMALANWAAEAGLGDAGDDHEASPTSVEPQSAPRPAPAAPEVGRPTMMQKAVPPSQLGYYVERGYDRVAGFVHRANEVRHLDTPAKLYTALALNHPGSPFSTDAEEIYVLRWPAYCPNLYRIPYGGQNEAAMRAMQGWVIEQPPFRGNGFAPSEGSDIIVEFKVDSARLPHGAELWRIGADGDERLVATFDGDARQWRQVGARGA